MADDRHENRREGREDARQEVRPELRPGAGEEARRDPRHEAPQETRKDTLRAALVAAAERVVAERGLSALRARDLARSTGRALGALYTVFPDLDALVLEVNRRTLALFDAHVRATDLARVEADLAQVEADPARVEADPARALVGLALAYLDFASAERLRWRALFQHRMADERAPPDWYVAEQARLFRHVEAPLARLRPDLPEAERALLARTLFSAVHGMVALGLDEKLVGLEPPVLRAQVEGAVAALARGLSPLPIGSGGLRRRVLRRPLGGFGEPAAGGAALHLVEVLRHPHELNDPSDPVLARRGVHVGDEGEVLGELEHALGQGLPSQPPPALLRVMLLAERRVRPHPAAGPGVARHGRERDPRARGDGAVGQGGLLHEPAHRDHGCGRVRDAPELRELARLGVELTGEVAADVGERFHCVGIYA